MPPKRRIAVVGSGITGLSAAWMLHRNGDHVTLYEREATCGGHTLTDDSSGYPVDLGFQVYNLTTYPNLVGFLEALGVDTEPSDMSFSLSIDDGRLEWGSHNLDTIFAQRSNCYSPSFLGMIRDVVRFGQQAPQVLKESNQSQYGSMSLGEYVKLNGYSQCFLRHYILPMSAAIWSVPEAQVLEFPITMLVRFWVNHHLLDLVQRPVWRVVKGRSRSYVNRVLEELPDVRTSSAVVSIQRDVAPDGSNRITVVTEKGTSDVFDSVVLATHSDTSLAVLGDHATEQERSVLGAIPYNDNDVYLHTDASLMPRDRKTWASWNFLGNSSPAPDETAVCVTYWINNLQRLGPGAPDLFVTLNPMQPPAKDKTIKFLKLAHPVYSFEAVKAQSRVSSIQGTRGTYYAGAWCGYGFHEDGLKAGVAAACALGAKVPWVPRATNPKVGLLDSGLLYMFDRFAKSTIRVGHLRFILPNGTELSYGSEETVMPPTPAGTEWRGRPKLQATLRVFDLSFFWKVVTRHDTGLGEAFMDGDFTVDDLGGLMAVLTANALNAQDSRGSLGLLNWLGDRLLYLAHTARTNTITGSRKNIEEHYDAGNDMYKLFLDETMTYSSGIHLEGDSLFQAQLRKLDAMIAQANITKDDHVLEIGCGWGSMSIRAAQTTGCRVTGVTISKQQLAEATKRVKAAGLTDRVKLIFCDYREIEGAGTFDAVISVEMIEAVGHEHLRSYHQVLGRMLKPGGRAVIQSITCPDERYESYCNSSDFIRAHVFPGGHLPSVGAMTEAARGTGLSMHAVTDIGPDYAITLREWRATWEERKEEILALGYSEKFWRKYRFYFAYCEAGFDAKYIYNLQIVWVKDKSTTDMVTTAGSREHLGQADLQQFPNDPITQVLLAIYFFLAGLLLQSHPNLWLTPLTSIIFATFTTLLHRITPILLPKYSNFSVEKQGWLCADASRLIYSSITAVASALYLCRQPFSFGQPHETPDRAPSMIACASTGYFAYMLWVIVRYRLYAKSVGILVQYTLLLILFGVVSYKNLYVPLLSVALLAEGNTALSSLKSLLACVTGNRSGLMDNLDKGSLIVLRVLPHLALGVVVALFPSAFASTLHYLLAASGMLAVNIINVHAVTASLV